MIKHTFTAGDRELYAARCPTTLIGDERTHFAALINPQANCAGYQDWARAHELRVRYVFLPDVSRLHQFTCIPDQWQSHKIYILNSQHTSFELEQEPDAASVGASGLKTPDGFVRLCPGDTFEFGNVRLKVVDRQDNCSCLAMEVYDLSQSDRQPQFTL